MADLPHHPTVLQLKTAFSLVQLRQSPAYDLVMRLPILFWSTALAVVSAAALRQFLRTADAALPVAAYCVSIAMRLSVIAYLLMDRIPSALWRRNQRLPRRDRSFLNTRGGFF